MPFYKYNNKKIHFTESGSGKILILLHGNSVSSKMFNPIKSMYTKKFLVITIDFLNNGLSERTSQIPNNIWYDQALQVIELCKVRGYKDINILGSSGGAYTAINIAIKEPNLVNNVFADSFGGKYSTELISGNIIEERKNALKDLDARKFWEHMHGIGYESVVLKDAQAIYKHHQNSGQFYCDSLNNITANVYLIGSKKDEFYSNIQEIFSKYEKEIKNCKSLILDDGGHPVSLSRSKEIFDVIVNELK